MEDTLALIYRLQDTASVEWFNREEKDEGFKVRRDSRIKAFAAFCDGLESLGIEHTAAVMLGRALIREMQTD